MDEISSIDSENPQQTENNSDFKNQDSSTSEIDIDIDTGLIEFWELVEPNVDDEMDKVSESNFSLHHLDEPIEPNIARGLSVEQDSKTNDKNPNAVKSGNFEKKTESNKTEVLKTYSKRSSRNVPPKYYGWSSFKLGISCVYNHEWNEK